MARGNTGEKTDGNVVSPYAPTQAMAANSTAAGDVLVCARCGTDAGENAYCASCGLHLAVEPDLPTRAAWQAGSAARRTPGVPAAKDAPKSLDRPASESRWPKVLVPIVGLVAAVALAVAVVGYVANRPNDTSLHRQIQQLQSGLSAANRKIDTQAATITSVKANSQAGAVTALQGQMTKMTVCLPELQQEVNGLNVSTAWQTIGGTNYLTSAYLTNPTIISGNCNKALNGP